MTQEERQKIFPDYFEKCNQLGWEYAKNISDMIQLYSNQDKALVRFK